MSSSILYICTTAIDVYLNQEWILGSYFNHRPGSSKGVLTSIQTHLLYHSYYPTLMGHPGERRMYNSVQSYHYWKQIANIVYTNVRDCRKCPLNWPSEKRRRPMPLLQANGPLEFVTMDISGLLLKTLSSHQFALSVEDRYTKVTRAIKMY